MRRQKLLRHAAAELLLLKFLRKIPFKINSLKENGTLRPEIPEGARPARKNGSSPVWKSVESRSPADSGRSRNQI
jgi:hypothetical protein